MISIGPHDKSLTDEEVDMLAGIGKRIVLSLSCDANGDGIPCRTDRFQAMEDMMAYLIIGMEDGGYSS